MNLPDWIPLAITVVTLAATWGEVRARLKAVEAIARDTAKDLKESRGGQGRRLGVLEERLAHVEGVQQSTPYRRIGTAARGIPIDTPAEESSEVTE